MYMIGNEGPQRKSEISKVKDDILNSKQMDSIFCDKFLKINPNNSIQKSKVDEESQN